MSGHLTPEQARAVERRDGSLMVSAGAGTGKTTVLVERFVRAVLEDEVPVEGILAITFTEKAAAEMRIRVRARFLELGRRSEARAAEAAWISTIHGFCSRVLRAHALSAGIDPHFRVLDELESERVATDAFDRALEAFMADGELPERVEMVASYTPDRLRDMVRTAHSRLRSRGERHPRLEEVEPPSAADQRGRLERALRAVQAELGAGEATASVRGALAKLESCAALLERLGPAELADPSELDDLSFAGRAKVLCTAVCDEYRAALEAYGALCGGQREYLDHTLLRVLMESYDLHYEEGKRGRSGLDFEDLELIARDLLRRDAALREHYGTRFEHVLVDEFQDTNPLQNDLLAQLDRDNVFRVGDQRQSIYGFRNADVGVFREHWKQASAAGRAQSVTVNFRSRGEVLDAIDLVFSRTWGEDFEPLREAEGARSAPPRSSPCVELLVTDRNKNRWDAALGTADPFGPAMHGVTPWRAAEARLLARRVDELTRESDFGWGDVVMLFRATTSIGLYERALEERGVSTHVVGGRGYWTQQQVADLRHWLAALANPLDELAVYSALASPLGGLSLDAVALIGLHARGRGHDPWRLLLEPDGLLELLPADDRRRARAFAQLFEEERRLATQVSLETLIDRAVTRTGYDSHLLSLPSGARRMANVRKLMRMAREYETREGRDLRGFIDSLAERDLVQAREGEAPLESETLDAVRLMTIHRAKGLEFPVVCVADLGKDGREDDGALRISDDGSLGLRLASLSGGSLDSARLARIKKEQRRAGEEEEKRIFYVAATRARDHLILSGATDLQGFPEPEELKEPMRWIWRGLVPTLTPEASGLHSDSWEGREVQVRYSCLSPGTVEELLPAGERVPHAVEAEPSRGEQQPELGLAALPAPRALAVSRLSYSSLQDYARCSYRFYLQRALKLPPVEPPPAAQAAPEAGFSARLRGSLVHLLLEELDFGRPLAPSEEEVNELLEAHGESPTPEAVADLRGMVERFAGSALRERISRARRVRTELPFAFTLTPPGAGGRSLLLNGVVDVHATEEEGLLVVDYKSDALLGRDPAAVTEEGYGTQRLVYALAGLRSGAPRVEVVHSFLELPEAPVSASFDAADAGRLEAELLELARGVVENRFTPTEDPHVDLCADCPGRPALCSWGHDMTLRPPGSRGLSVGTRT